MKFLNKNAYIQTAIFGYSFCTAAKKAFFLIARNIMRVMAVGVVSEVVLVLGKVRLGDIEGATPNEVRRTCRNEYHPFTSSTLLSFVNGIAAINSKTWRYSSHVMSSFYVYEESRWNAGTVEGAAPIS